MKLPGDFFNHDAQAGGFYPKSHVGVDISGFGRRQNVLIEGIRGTGKTHILRMITRYYLDNFQKLRILPIYVSLAQLSEHTKKQPDEFRLHLYAHIVQKCVETVEVNLTSLQSDKNLLEKAMQYTARLFGIEGEPDISDLLSKINQAVELLLFKLQYDLTSESFTKSKSETKSNSSEGGVNIGFDSGAAKAVLNRGTSDGFSLVSGAESTLNYIGGRLVHHNASSFIVEFLQQIQIILSLEYSLILIDECSEASFEAQVEVFRLFKAIRGSSSKSMKESTCAHFIGTVYPKSETYYPTRDKDGFSFEQGQDFTMDFLQWDETDLETYVPFFQNMILSRAQELLEYSGDFTSFCDDLFENLDTFLLAAYCAHGIPRRFWEIVKRSYDQSVGKILFNRVLISVQEIVNNQILASRNLGAEDIEFTNTLIGLLTKLNTEIRTKNGKRKSQIPQNIYFSMKQKYVDLINKLVMQGAIHDKARMRTTVRLSRPQPIYAIDIAVAFTFRVIPQLQLVKVVTNDLPKCPSGDFNQAPEIYSYIMKETYGEKNKNLEFEDSSEKINSGAKTKNKIKPEKNKIKEKNKPATGTVTSLYYGAGGSLVDDVTKFEINFGENDVDNETRGMISVGDKVRYEAQSTVEGETNAKKVVKIGMQKSAEGIVKLYSPDNFGFIEVSDGGPNAYFLARTIDKRLRQQLKPGDQVTFQLIEGTRGREGHDIKFLTPNINQVDTIKLEELSGYVRMLVRESPSPLKVGDIYHQVTNHFGDSILNSRWLGFGSFRMMFEKMELENLVVSMTRPAYVYDPTIHEAPALPQVITEQNGRSVGRTVSWGEFESQYPDIYPFAQRICGLIRIPNLPPPYYATLFIELAKEINENGFQRSGTARAVRDRYVSLGLQLGKSPIDSIVRSLQFQKYDLNKDSQTAMELGNEFINNIIFLCNKKGLQLSDQELDLFRKWIIGRIQ